MTARRPLPPRVVPDLTPPLWSGPTDRGRRLIAHARELLARARRWEDVADA